MSVPLKPLVIYDRWRDRYGGLAFCFFPGVYGPAWYGLRTGVPTLILLGSLVVAAWLCWGVHALRFARRVHFDPLLGTVREERWDWRFRRCVVDFRSEELFELRWHDGADSGFKHDLKLIADDGRELDLPSGASRRFESVYEVLSEMKGEPMRCRGR